VAEYVRTCQTCQRTKAEHGGPCGLLHPLPLPSRRGGMIGVDWIAWLPTTAGGFDMIQNHIDLLSGKVHAIPTRATATAADAAEIIRDMCLRSGDGFPDVLVVNHDPKFTSDVVRAFVRSMGSCLIVGLAYHKDINAKVERANGVIGDTLRAYANGRKDDWDRQLPLAVFAINNAASTLGDGLTPLPPISASCGRGGMDPSRSLGAQATTPTRSRSRGGCSAAQRSTLTGSSLSMSVSTLHRLRARCRTRGRRASTRWSCCSTSRCVTRCLVRWRGHTSADDEWLRTEELVHCQEKVAECDAAAPRRRAARRLGVPGAGPVVVPTALAAGPCCGPAGVPVGVLGRGSGGQGAGGAVDPILVARTGLGPGTGGPG
jgi:hypothetical protein